MPVALVTGAAGLIGGDLVARLIGEGWGVLALVRADRDVRSNDGQAVPTEDWSGTVPAPGQTVLLTGDVAETGCGLTDEMAKAVSTTTDLIIHCAAVTAFDAPWATYKAVNIGGTTNALALARDARFFHVSTAYVCGEADGPVAEVAASPDAAFTNGYERSKAMAESIVSSSGRDWAIARPSIVVGDSRTGAIRKFDTIYALFRLLAEGRIGTIAAAPHAALNLVPVDHVTDSLMAMIDNWGEVRGGSTHICAAQSVGIEDFVDAFATVPGLTGPRIVPPEAFDLAMLAPVERRLFQRVMFHYQSYFRRNPQFLCERLRAATGLASPTLDRAPLQRMVQHSIEAGLITPRQPVAAE